MNGERASSEDAKPSGYSPLEPEKARLEWGYAQAERLWNGLYARYAPQIDGRVILDLGCSWGYLLMYLHRHFAPEKTIGVDIAPLWDEVPHGWDYRALGRRVEFHRGRLTDIQTLEPSSIDLVLCTSVLQYLRPEEVLATLERIYDLLRPGGEMILRTRCFTSYIGADLHQHYVQDYIHLLAGMHAIERDLREWKQVEPRYLNKMCPSNYVCLFQQSGLEILDLQRRPNRRSLKILAELKSTYPWIDPLDLETAEIEARLVRPLEPEEMNFCAEMVSTRPKSNV